MLKVRDEIWNFKIDKLDTNTCNCKLSLEIYRSLYFYQSVCVCVCTTRGDLPLFVRKIHHVTFMW